MHPKLMSLIPIADGINATVGPYSEIVIHDITQPDQSVVYIAGNVTNRQIGAPLTDLVLESYSKHGDRCEDMLSYGTTTREGKTLRSSTIFVRDDNGIIVGCMCLNVDLSPMVAWKYFLETSLDTKAAGMVKETFATDVSEALNAIIKSVVEMYACPPGSLPREERLSVIEQLDAKGVFMVKGAIDQIANELGVSRYSIYNYLDEVRAKK